MITWKVESQRYFVEKLDKDGVVKSRMVVVTKLLVVDPDSIGNSGYFRVVRVFRNKEVRYSLSVMGTIPQPWWSNPSGKAEAWSILGKYARLESLTESGLMDWLERRKLPGRVILDELGAKVPVRKAA